jgi:heme-degrading monooxygenase HmoA
MVLEQAVLQVRAGADDAFRAALAKARPLIAASPGFVSLEVRPASEVPGRYLLLVGSL